MTKANIVLVNATQLKPGAKYIFAIDKDAMDMEQVAQLARMFKKMGIENSIAIMTNGNPKKMIKIIEQE